MKDTQPRATILAIGNELLSGSTLDTNSRFLSGFLAERGVRTHKIITVLDSLSDIENAVGDAVSGTDIVFCSGGLGPTSDDITRNALAAFSADELVQNIHALARMQEKYRLRGIPESRVSLRQVTFPSRAEIVPNNYGTADAFLLTLDGGERAVPILALPGVPSEFEGIVSSSVSPILDRFFPTREPISRRSIRVFGLPESLIGEKIEALALPETLEVSYRAFSQHVVVSLLTTAVSASEALDGFMREVVQTLGPEFVVGRDEKTGLIEAAAELLLSRSETVAFAESCTGGKLCDLLIALPGASRYIRGGVVAYAEQAKTSLLGVSERLLTSEGAVSAACAAEMARSARGRFDSTYGVSTTGFAGPDGGNDRYPVGTLFVAVATSGGVEVMRHQVVREREAFRQYAALLALQLLRSQMLEANCRSI